MIHLLIKVNYLNIPLDMQEKTSAMCLRFGSEYPSLGYLPMGGNSASLVTAQWAGTLGTDIPIRTAKHDRYYYYNHI
jgi:hypothetical protein